MRDKSPSDDFRVKLGVFYPWSSPFTFTKFTENVLNLQKPEGVEVRFFRGDGWCPSRRHNDGCEKALEWGADLILCIGTDQTYPEDLLVRLVARWRELGGVITALVPFRGHVGWNPGMKPFQPLAWKIECEGLREFRGMQQDPDMLKAVDPKDGDVQRINLIGSGVLMFHRDHLLALKKPWFYDRVDPETMHRVADTDTRFVWRLQSEAGATVWCDTTIKVRHLHIFSIDDTFQNRFQDWADDGKSDDETIRYHLKKKEPVLYGPV